MVERRSSEVLSIKLTDDGPVYHDQCFPFENSWRAEIDRAEMARRSIPGSMVWAVAGQNLGILGRSKSFAICNNKINTSHYITHTVIFTARCYASAVLAMGLCLSVCPSQVGVPSKRMNESSWFLARELPSTRPTLC